MASQLTELCTLLVETTFGDLAAQIFDTLARHGRQTLSQLRDLTDIPVRRLKHGISILTQHHIFLHSAADANEPVFYQVDRRAAYVLVRSPKLAGLIEKRHGEIASHVFETILQMGHASVGDLAVELEFDTGAKGNNGARVFEPQMSEGLTLANGHDDHTRQEATGYEELELNLSRFHGALRSLLASGFLAKVHERTYVPKADLEAKIKNVLLAEQFHDGKITGPKKAKEFKAAADRLKRKWEEEDGYSSSNDVASSGSTKRTKLSASGDWNSSHVNGHHGVRHSVRKLPNDIVVRVDYCKCIVALRTLRLEQMASRFLGHTTGAVYGTLLRVAERKLKSVQYSHQNDSDDSEDEADMFLAVTDHEVLEALDKSVDLAANIKGVEPRKALNGTSNYRDKGRLPEVTEDEVKEERALEDEDGSDVDGLPSVRDRGKRMLMLDAHLQILGEHQKKFLHRSTNGRESRLDFVNLSQILIQAEIDVMVQSRFGKTATRTIRMLREKGKLEDKQIATMSMMPFKRVRAALTALQFQGLVEVQEVPKDNTRQPSRTVYLWYFDEERAQSLYLERIYQGMSRVLERVQVEKTSKYRAVIEKAERKDVKGREDALLTTTEKEMLRQWREVEERLLVQVSRMDDVVILLRDLGERDTSLMT